MKASVIEILAKMAVHRWIGWLGMVPILIVLTSWGLERTPPMQVISVDATEVIPGGLARFGATLWRDRERDCSADYIRHIYFSDGTRIDASNGVQFSSAAQVREFEARQPGRFALALQIPNGAPPGPAKLEISLQYKCNPLHSLWPINVYAVLPFTILPTETP